MTDRPSITTDADSGRLANPEREWLDAVQSATSLRELVAITGAESEHEAYLDAKDWWKTIRQKEGVAVDGSQTGLPGTRIELDDRTVFIHGITHADTDAERTVLRNAVSTFLEEGSAVYCEQGIRPMYFDDFETVREVDDYRWAMHHCRERDLDSHIPGAIEREFAEDQHIGADLRSVAAEFRKETFSLIKSGESVYGDRFTSALGDVASDFLTSHEELATAEDFASFRLSRRAAKNPDELGNLQEYYETVFLPQPLEREWLRRHDPELELFTHARNERIAAYVLYHAPADSPVHIITGAAHQPGIAYYLEQYRDGDWSFEPFETVP